MSLHTQFNLPTGERVVNMERGIYTVAPDGFFGSEAPRVEVLEEPVKGAAVAAYHRAAGGILMELSTVGRPGAWIRTGACVATTPCPESRCGSAPGVPCAGKFGAGTGFHSQRQRLARDRKHGDRGVPVEPGQVWAHRYRAEWFTVTSIVDEHEVGIDMKEWNGARPTPTRMLKSEVRLEYRLRTGEEAAVEPMRKPKPRGEVTAARPEWLP